MDYIELEINIQMRIAMTLYNTVVRSASLSASSKELTLMSKGELP